MGRWDECVEVSDEVVAHDNALGGTQLGVIARASKADVLLARGRLDDARDLCQRFLREALQVKDPQVRVPALITATNVESAERRPGEGRAATVALAKVVGEGIWPPYLGSYPEAAEALVGAGSVKWARRWMDASRFGMPAGQHGAKLSQAAIAEATGEWAKAVVQYGEAASAWEGFHAPYDQARALLGQGRCLLRAGSPYEARGPLRSAARLLGELGALPALAEAESLLQEAGERSG
jgi:hypothetical protein